MFQEFSWALLFFSRAKSGKISEFSRETFFSRPKKSSDFLLGILFYTWNLKHKNDLNPIPEVLILQVK